MDTTNVLPETWSYLSKAEVTTFLRTILRIDLSREQLKPPSLEFLKKVYRNFTMYVPYSSLRYVPKSAAEYRLPTIQELRDAGMANKGGLCYDTNVFLSWILLGLGYKVCYNIGKIYGAKTWNHLSLVVHHENAAYFVDAASGMCFAPNLISLDFDDQSPEYSSSFWTVKFQKPKNLENEGSITGAYLLTENTNASSREVELLEPGWAKFLELNPKYLSLQDLAVPMGIAYRDRELAPVLIRLFVYRLPGGKMRMLRKNEFISEIDGKRVVRKCETEEELLNVILKNFGDTTDRETALRAVKASFKYPD